MITDRSDYTVILPNGVPLDMIFIAGGSFDMGDHNLDRAEPVHRVNVSSFYLGRYPITNEQFVPFLNEKGNQEESGRTWVDLDGKLQGAKCGIRKSSNGFECIQGFEKHPMNNVSWYGARAYTGWLRAETGQEYRLPSEAEWEYAARSGQDGLGLRYAGSKKLKEVGWYNLNSHSETKPVGLKLPNELGLYDMSGNVWEWCADHWHDNYGETPTGGSAWLGGSSETQHVVRGGSWVSDDINCSVSYRRGDHSHVKYGIIGFRPARD